MVSAESYLPDHLILYISKPPKSPKPAKPSKPSKPIIQ